MTSPQSRSLPVPCISNEHCGPPFAEPSGNVTRLVRPCSFQVPTTQQLTYFAAFFGAGLFFLVIAFGIALPVIVLAPAKFAFRYELVWNLCCG